MANEKDTILRKKFSEVKANKFQEIINSNLVTSKVHDMVIC